MPDFDLQAAERLAERLDEAYQREGFWMFGDAAAMLHSAVEDKRRATEALTGCEDARLRTEQRLARAEKVIEAAREAITSMGGGFLLVERRRDALAQALQEYAHA